jgi:hypothetical protein
MASFIDIGTAVTDYLITSKSHIYNTVNADVPGALSATGAVVICREPQDDGGSVQNQHETAIELIPRPDVTRAIGVGFVERDSVFGVRIVHRARDEPKGDAAVTLVRKIVESIRYEFDGKANHSTLASPAGSTFRYTTVSADTLDPVWNRGILSAELTLVFTFTHRRTDNS